MKVEDFKPAFRNHPGALVANDGDGMKWSLLGGPGFWDISIGRIHGVCLYLGDKAFRDKSDAVAHMVDARKGFVEYLGKIDSVKLSDGSPVSGDDLPVVKVARKALSHKGEDRVGATAATVSAVMREVSQQKGGSAAMIEYFWNSYLDTLP